MPVVLKTCTETIEAHGIVEGIYRLNGVASNIRRLRYLSHPFHSLLQRLYRIVNFLSQLPLCLLLTLRLLSAGGPDIIFCNNVQSAGDPDRTLHAKSGSQPAVRLERYMKVGTASRRSGYTHRPSV